MVRKSSSGLRKLLLKSRAEKLRKANDLLRELVNNISSEFPRSAVVLFGSRAQGKYSPQSDFDIAVVLEEVEDKFETITRLRRLKPPGISLDLVLLTVRELEDPLMRKMLEGGRVLYNGLNLGRSLIERL